MGKKTKILLFITWVCLVLMIISNIASIYFVIENNKGLGSRVENTIQKKIDSLPKQEVIQGKDGYTPQLNIDYFNGSKGEKGDKGDAAQGIKGDQGNIGKSAYDLAVENGFDGSIKDWFMTLKGDSGYTPVKGIDYFDGVTPITRCNETKNRWEVTTNGGLNYEIIYNENNEPTKCKAQ